MDLTQDELNDIVDRTVAQKIAELKLASVVADHTETLESTERLLSIYPSIRELESERAKDATELIEFALFALRADPYIKIIPLIYFYKYSREEVAKRFGVSPATVTRNKNRLLKTIKSILFYEV